MKLFTCLSFAVFVFVGVLSVFVPQSAKAQLADCGEFKAWYGALICRDTQLSKSYMKMSDLIGDISANAPKEVLLEIAKSQNNLDASLTSCRDMDVLSSYGGDIKVCLKSIYDMEVANLERIAMSVSDSDFQMPNKMNDQTNDQMLTNEESSNYSMPQNIYPEPVNNTQVPVMIDDNMSRAMELEITTGEQAKEDQTINNRKDEYYSADFGTIRFEDNYRDPRMGADKKADEKDVSNDKSVIEEVVIQEYDSNIVAEPNPPVREDRAFDIYNNCRIRSGDNMDSLEACVYSAFDATETELRVVSSRIEVAMGMPDPEYASKENKSNVSFYGNILNFRRYTESYCEWMSSLFADYIRRDLLVKSCSAELYSQRIDLLSEVADNMDTMKSIK